MIENAINGTTVKCVYDSLDQWAGAAAKRATDDYSGRDSWRGADMAEALRLAKFGWEDELSEALAIAESAVDMVEKDHQVKAFTPVWDVTGCEVDIARYLSGEPENMIDFPTVDVSQHGRVITLCASISYSGAVDPDVIKRRGQVLCALALVLSRIGYASELWVNMHAEARNSLTADFKVMVKGANDTLDPAKVMFAYAHPAALRVLMFAIMDGLPSKFRNALGTGRGRPRPPIQDLPDGTIYMPELRSASNVPDAHTLLKDFLRQIGLLREEV